jgi:hypothetical protein
MESSLVAALGRMTTASGVAVRHLVERDDAVKDPARFDPAFQDVGEKIRDVGARRSRSARHTQAVRAPGANRTTLTRMRG